MTGEEDAQKNAARGCGMAWVMGATTLLNLFLWAGIALGFNAFDGNIWHAMPLVVMALVACMPFFLPLWLTIIADSVLLVLWLPTVFFTAILQHGPG